MSTDEERNGRMDADDEPRYFISIAARLVGLQTHTLRYYEKIGIVGPSRSRGNIRLYSERDIDLLRKVKTLMDDLGVNLAGVEVILRMSDRIIELQKRIGKLESEVDELREVDK
ncbi:MAG: MerR family transcriptional regulator [Chloroflexota bacterium]